MPVEKNQKAVAAKGQEKATDVEMCQMCGKRPALPPHTCPYAAVHVTPVNDTRPHVESGDRCWCNPRIERSDPKTGEVYEVPLVIHKAADGREMFEGAAKN